MLIDMTINLVQDMLFNQSSDIEGLELIPTWVESCNSPSMMARNRKYSLRKNVGESVTEFWLHLRHAVILIWNDRT